MRAGAPPPGFDPAELAPPPLPDREWPLAAVALDVSGACNIACRYCAEAATQPRRRAMDEATLEAAWRQLAPDGRARPGTSIRLGSGEPLLALPLLQRLQERILAAGGSPAEGRPDVFLTTNGTLATPAVRNWLVAAGWHVKVSLDGPREVHDRWRVTRRGLGTFDRAAEAVSDLARRIPERLAVTAVLCHGADPAEVFEAVGALGVRRIELVPAAHLDAGVLPDLGDLARYRRFITRYARGIANGEGSPVLIRFESRVRRVLGYDLARVPCAAGRTMVAVDAGGDLYPCFRFVGVAPYRLGGVERGLDRRAAAAFRRGPGRPVELRPPCDRCWAAPLCAGPCFACAELLGPGGGRPLPIHCGYVRADARAAVRLVARLRRSHPERLLSFLPEARAALDALA
jgi:uncharacterized protein